MQNDPVTDQELQNVIADFLEMGHVENIISMFRHQPDYFQWSGILLADERINVRMGLTILFEEIKAIDPEQLNRAIPSLTRLLSSEEPLYRGEAVSLLGIIGGPGPMTLIRSLSDDPSPHVQEMVQMVLDEAAP